MFFFQIRWSYFNCFNECTDLLVTVTNQKFKYTEQLKCKELKIHHILYLMLVQDNNASDTCTLKIGKVALSTSLQTHFALITILTRLDTDLTNFGTWMTWIRCHSSWTTSFNSVIFAGEGFRALIARFIVIHKFSMWFKSELYGAGHSIHFWLFLFFHAFTRLARCTGALSSCNIVYFFPVAKIVGYANFLPLRKETYDKNTGKDFLMW